MKAVPANKALLLLLLLLLTPETVAAPATTETLRLIPLAVTGLAGTTQIIPPLAVKPAPTLWLRAQVQGTLAFLLAEIAAGNATMSRDLPNGALGSLLLQVAPTRSAAGVIDVDCSGLNTSTAMMLLRRFGPRTDTSFNGQSYPLIWHGYERCLSPDDRAWLLDVLNASLPQTWAEATTQDYSYTNMFLMSAVNTILFGEIVGGNRGIFSAAIGYRMFNTWYNYTRLASIHEFTSPTYTHVQVTALHAGFIYAAGAGARAQFRAALDLIWSDTCANYYPPQASLTGPHSRDYDTLLGHGIHDIEIYVHGLPGATPPRCEWQDPHCEGPTEGAVNGTGEPMTVDAISFFNLVHPNGYAPTNRMLSLTSLPERTVQSKFLALATTANGNEARFGDLYNFITDDYAIGSASQDYITRTHGKYFPYVGDKLVNVLLGPLMHSGAESHGRALPQISLQPDWMDNP